MYHPRDIATISMGLNASTITAGSNLEVNVVASSQAAGVVNKIPSELLGGRGATSKGSLQGWIEDIRVYQILATNSNPNLATIRFFGNDDFVTTTLTSCRELGAEEFDTGDFNVTIISGGTVAIGNIGNLRIPYRDDDDTGEFHVRIENDSTTDIAKNSQNIEFTWRPEYPI